ncbi:MAG: small basic protein [bacterium]|jgi:small basic protein (TIGR04137 family)|nr:small basic protein [Phycisphaeraceae bacterium]
MSIDRSLKIKSGLAVNRSVYTRAERLAKLVESKKKDTGKDGILGVPKTRVAKA